MVRFRNENKSLITKASVVVTVAPAIESAVGEHGCGLAVAKQRDGLDAVVALAAGEDEVQRQAVFFVSR